MPKKILLVIEPSKGLTVITNIVEPTLFLSKMAVWVSYFPPDTSEEPAEIWSTNFSNTRFWKAKIEPIKKFCTKIRGNWLNLCGRRRHLLCKQNWRMASSCAYDLSTTKGFTEDNIDWTSMTSCKKNFYWIVYVSTVPILPPTHDILFKFSVSNLRNEVERWNSVIIFGDKTYARPVHKI